ncbi:MAG: rhamnogalacturonan acetylesterase [Paraglaciecola sp.]|uniref:rhamnogalacturonan acetylesterase n=1 Tax=Paraglaciecola sp. TaxID=1920173 RepID=UPI00273EDB0C|nr:rhamnogalacturonan acetylesterase [Paraglaciecola sp.]MDP5032179.1 rhamnogalacturonan acetylesterase [Paraglaciecola sp.]MDP5133075.1 rhamnogalacturonan acetylesterase [Paraglaciecola sp.]
MQNLRAEENSGLKILMAGDSTMAIKDLKDYPETGWGMPFATFFNESVAVHNFAKNGRSTKTFRSEGLWQELIDLCQTGDYVFIQFGHNDESESKVDRYTTPAQYRQNLINYINEVRFKKAHAILLSPVTRRNFNEQGSIKLTHPYSELVKQVAEETKVEYIDMDTLSRDYFTELGEQDSLVRFMHIAPDLHPNYPNGVKDNTHFNELGAREVAQLVLAELKQRKHPLLQHLRPVDPKHLSLHY